MDLRSAIRAVSPAKQRELMRRMAVLGIREDDIDESFVRSSGKGGQNVNRVATCVVLLHRPSGTRVKCQIARTQGLNRYYARTILAERIEGILRGRESARHEQQERIRRQKRRRSKRAKEKMLAEKRRFGEKKALRKKVLFTGDE